MPNDRQQQLDALKRNMCGDCGVGPFKGGGRSAGAGVSPRVVWGVGVGVVVAVGVAIALFILR